MEIKVPKDCIACPLIKLGICGEKYKEYKTSGAVYFGMRPDDRCFMRRAVKNDKESSKNSIKDT